MKDGKNFKDPFQERNSKLPGPRGRYNNACDMCRRKKIKCDGIKPVCNQCQRSGRKLECMWNKNPARQPRTEQHFEALHKRAENVHKVLNEYRRYADYLESLLDQKSSGDFDFRSLRPSIPDGLMGTIPIESRHAEFTLEIEQDESSDSDDPTLSRLAAKGLTFDEGGHILHHGDMSPFRFRKERATQPSRFPAILENPRAMYVLIVDSESEAHYNPDFDWSRHLPSAVPLDRRTHDKALDLFFKYFASWCVRIIPGLFLRDMCHSLSVPSSRDPPKTPHYSPMLHNALVALALAFVDDARFRDFKTRQYFADKAKSYLEAECQRPNISVVQALSFIGSFHSSQGDQTLGYLYFGMSARVSQTLGLNIDCIDWVKSGQVDESERHDRNWTNWTIFAQDVCWSIYVGRDFTVPIPDLPMPLVDTAHDGMLTTYGPLNKEPQPNLLTKTFEATCQLLVISRRIMDVVNSLSKRKVRPYVIDELISDIDVQLNDWKGSLSPDLEITVKSRPTASPHKLMLHLAYWWLFILLHRPFFRRKARPIASTDREIDHVKLCRRAAENIMEHLATWRSLYTLRYCPVTLAQTVFSAGTVYLLTATQASSGLRVAWKELNHASTQLDLILDYLQEVGASWQCSTNIASILRGQMQDQPQLLLNGKSIDIDNSLRVPYRDDEDERTSQGHRDRMPPRKESVSRSRSRALSNPKLRQERRGSQSRPTVSVTQDSENSNVAMSLASASQSQLLQPTEPLSISIQIPSGPPSICGSPSSLSFIDGSGNSPSPLSRSSSLSDTSDFRNSSPSTSFNQSPVFRNLAFSKSDQHLSGSWDVLKVVEPESAYSPSSSYASSLGGSFGTIGQSGSSSQPYFSPEVLGFTGMLGGQELSLFPSFGIPMNVNGSVHLNSPGLTYTHHHLSSGNLQMHSLDTNMDQFDQLLMDM